MSVNAKPLDESAADANGTGPEISVEQTTENNRTIFFIVCSTQAVPLPEEDIFKAPSPSCIPGSDIYLPAER